jgi:serine/threonine protein kinase
MGATPSPNGQPQTGKVLSDRYALTTILGHGSFATSWLGEDQLLHRRVVIKLFSGNQAHGAALFSREGKITLGLSHHNIVALLGVGVTEDNQPFLVTEYVDGESLGSILRNSGPLAVNDAVSVGIGLGSALSYVHGRNLLHRDLKPSNVLIPGWPMHPDYRGAKVLDFGVAGQLEDGRTRSGAVFGTPRYMSPEQILGEPQSAATDVYGLGLLLLEMLVGHPPVERSHSPTALFKAILEGQAPEKDLAAVPEDLASLIRECLRRNPAERPSVADILKKLRAFRSAAAMMTSEATLPAPRAPQPGEFTRVFKAQNPLMVPPVPVQPAPPSVAEAAQTSPKGLDSETRDGKHESLGAPINPEPEIARRRMPWILAALSGALAVAVPLLVYGAIWHARHATHHSHWLRVLEFLVGLLVMSASILVAFWLRGWLAGSSNVADQAYQLVLGAKDRVDLTATMAFQLDELIARLHDLDDRILAGSVVLMLNEYGSASDPKDRQAALMNVVALSEKLARHLAPWYERYKEVIASAVAVMGGVSGLMTAINSVLAHKH